MSSKIFDTVIVGAGVSGISCAVELKIKKIDNIAVVEKSDNFFNTIRTFYKDGKRVDKNWRNQIIELLGSIDFDGGLKEEILDYFQNLLKKHNINPLYNSEVEKIIKNSDDIFEVHLKSNILSKKCLEMPVIQHKSYLVLLITNNDRLLMFKCKSLSFLFFE